MVFDRCSRRSYTSYNNKILNGDTNLSQGYFIAASPTPVYEFRDKQNL